MKKISSKNIINGVLSVLLVALVSTNVYQLYQRQYITDEYEQLKKVSSSTENDAAMAKFNSLLGIYDKYYYKDIAGKEKYVDNMIKEFQKTTGDKYSSYFDKETMIMEERSFSGEYYGIGITFTAQKEKDTYLTISEVKNNGPAFKSGIKVGTKIYEINSAKINTKEFDVVLKAIASGKATNVKLKTDKGDYNVIPQKIDLDTVNVKYENDLAVVTITSFTTRTGDEFLKVFNEIEKNSKVKGLLFDLRNNHGGDKDAVTKIVDRLAPSGLLYKEKYKGYSNDVKSDAKHTELPIAILGNGETASASELFTMTLQDTNHAVLVGEKTYGKSTILIYLPFDDGTAMMLSTGYYYPPSGRFIEGKGIEPDIKDSVHPYETGVKYLEDKIKSGK